MTVSEMAERLDKRGAAKAAFIERVHHWTRERLLKPAGKRNPGTGRHRVYAESVLEDVKILNKMADMGFPIGEQRKNLTDARDKKAEWRAKAKPGVSLFLEIAVLPDGRRFRHLHEGTAFTPNGAAEAAVIFNLSRLFAPAAATLSLTTSVPDVAVTTSKKGR
jgi:DNA-binding transcriptional MerR regulator